MNTKKQFSGVYQSPVLFERELFVEGVLCQSGSSTPFPGGNESYGGDPGEDDAIF